MLQGDTSSERAHGVLVIVCSDSLIVQLLVELTLPLDHSFRVRHFKVPSDIHTLKMGTIHCSSFF